MTRKSHALLMLLTALACVARLPASCDPPRGGSRDAERHGLDGEDASSTWSIRRSSRGRPRALPCTSRSSTTSQALNAGTPSLEFTRESRRIADRAAWLAALAAWRVSRRRHAPGCGTLPLGVDC